MKPQPYKVFRAALSQRIAVGLVGLIIATVIIRFAVLPHVLYSGPVVRDTPLMREISSIHQICIKLRGYADEHPSFPSGTATGKRVDSLVTAGILSADDGAYINLHHIEFKGFDPSRISPDIAVVEVIFTNTEKPRRILGYSDGSVVTYDLHKAK